MAAGRKYNRTGYFDVKQKIWKSYYIAPSGKYVVEKFDNFSDLKTDLKTNYKPKLSRDLIPKKRTALKDKEKPVSAITTDKINNVLKIQHSIEYQVRQLRKNGVTDFKRLEKNILDTNYKPEILNRIPRTFLPDEKSYSRSLYDISYRGYKYPRPLWIGQDSFDRMKEIINNKRGTLYHYKKINIDIGPNKEISGVLDKAAFKSKDSFEENIKKLVKGDPGFKNQRYEKMTITLKGIKY